MDYGKKISYLRKTKGMTQEELGKVLNVTYQAVSKWNEANHYPILQLCRKWQSSFRCRSATLPTRMK